MKSRRKDVSEDRIVTSKRHKRNKKNSVNGSDIFESSIPMDLVIEIFSRVESVKSIAKCRCVSKLWSSILRRPDFTELFLTRSRSRPKLLLACHKICPKRENGELFFFTAPQLQNPDKNSSPVTANYQMKVTFNYKYERVRLINGLVFLRDERNLKTRTKPAKVSVCRPSTGQSLLLSNMETKKWKGIYIFLGYDPIEKQFKVLSMTYEEYQVMTLGTREMSWRKVECTKRHRPDGNVICINGVLYYRAFCSGGGIMIVCFDIRSEKFRFMEAGNNIIGHNGILINYNGKLGSLVSEGCYVSGKSKSFVLWLLEDTGDEHKWSKHVYVLPSMWSGVVGNIGLDFVGVIGKNVFVFSPFAPSSSFCLFYYNIERNTVRRVEIKGWEASKTRRVYAFVNYVEDIKLIM